MNDEIIIDLYLRVLVRDFLPKMQNEVTANHSRRVSNLEKNISDCIEAKERRFTFSSKKRKKQDIDDLKTKLTGIRNSHSPKIELLKDRITIWIYILSNFSSDYINKLSRDTAGLRGGGLRQSSFSLIRLEDEIRVALQSSPEVKTLSEHLSASITPMHGDFVSFFGWSLRDEQYLQNLVKGGKSLLLGAIRLNPYYEHDE